MIGEGMSVAGTLLFGDGVVRLDGRLEGKIIGQGTLVIGEGGSMQGEVEVGTLILGGLMEGFVVANGSARITSTDRLFGKSGLRNWSSTGGASSKEKARRGL